MNHFKHLDHHHLPFGFDFDHPSYKPKSDCLLKSNQALPIVTSSSSTSPSPIRSPSLSSHPLQPPNGSRLFEIQTGSEQSLTGSTASWAKGLLAKENDSLDLKSSPDPITSPPCPRLSINIGTPLISSHDFEPLTPQSAQVWGMSKDDLNLKPLDENVLDHLSSTNLTIETSTQDTLPSLISPGPITLESYHSSTDWRFEDGSDSDADFDDACTALSHSSLLTITREEPQLTPTSMMMMESNDRLDLDLDFGLQGSAPPNLTLHPSSPRLLSSSSSSPSSPLSTIDPDLTTSSTPDVVHDLISSLRRVVNWPVDVGNPDECFRTSWTAYPGRYSWKSAISHTTEAFQPPPPQLSPKKSQPDFPTISVTEDEVKSNPSCSSIDHQIEVDHLIQSHPSGSSSPTPSLQPINPSQTPSTSDRSSVQSLVTLKTQPSTSSLEEGYHTSTSSLDHSETGSSETIGPPLSPQSLDHPPHRIRRRKNLQAVLGAGFHLNGLQPDIALEDDLGLSHDRHLWSTFTKKMVRVTTPKLMKPKFKPSPSFRDLTRFETSSS